MLMSTHTADFGQVGYHAEADDKEKKKSSGALNL